MAGGQAILLEVALVILLPAPECGCGFDRGDDGTTESSGSRKSLLPLLRDAGLFGAVCEDHRAILRSHVGTLPVQLCWIVFHEEDVDELLIRHFLRVVGHLDDFCVAGAVCAHLSIGGVRHAAAGITDCGVMNAGDLAEERLHAPKTTRTKSGFLHRHSLLEPGPSNIGTRIAQVTLGTV